MANPNQAWRGEELAESFTRRVAARLRVMLAHRRMPLAVAVVAAIAMAPALGGGWQFDDWFQRATMLGYGDTRPINVFVQYIDRQHNLSQLAFGTMPWWGSPNMRLAFLRYASALSMMVDYHLWPNHPALMHLHSLLWLAAAVLCAALLYREVLGATWVAGLAALLYALDGAHAVPAAYLADRNALITATVGFLSVLCFARWCARGGREQRLLSAGLLALSLSAGEMGVATAAYLFSYAVTLGSGKIRSRLLSLWPHVIVLGAWAAIYKLCNFGSNGGGYYVDPLHDPLRFAASLWKHATYLLMGQWTPVPAELSLAFPSGSPQTRDLLIFGVVIVVLLAALLIPLVLRDRVARFWGLGMLLALVPICAVGSENRLLTFVGLGAMALLAQLTQAAFANAAASAPVWKRCAQAGVIVLLPLHLIASPLLGVARINFQDRISARMLHAIASVPDDPSLSKQTLVLVNPPEQISLVTAIWAVRRVENLPMPQRMRTLSAGCALQITRVGARSLRVRFPDGFFPTPYSRFLRSRDDRFSAGQQVRLPGLLVTVQSLDSNGDPLQVVYQFSAPLDDPSLRWMRWRDGSYVPWNPPKPGGTVRMPAPAGIY